MKKNLIILGIRGIPAAHGGFETFVERLAPYLRDRGWNVTVYCQKDGGSTFEDDWQGIKRIHIPAKGNGSWGTIEFDVKCVADLKKRSGIILTLGYNTGFLSSWIRMSGRKNIINMDGLEWKREKYSLGPKAYLWMNERLAAQAGNHLVADHPEIARHLATRVNSKKIVMIPYGSEQILSADESILARYNLEKGKYFTLIARPEPENSILEIVSAFSRKPRGAKLVVLGTYSDKHSYQKKVKSAAGSEVLFIGAVYERNTLDALRFYSLAYFHGHQVGGTNPSLVEALGASNAVIAHDNPFNRWVAGDGGCYFRNMEDIENLVTKTISGEIPTKILSKASARRWSSTFTWDKILKSYEELLHCSPL